MFKEKVKKFWNKHRGVIITAGVGIGAGLCYLLISKDSYDVEALAQEASDELYKEQTQELGWNECLVDGEIKPIFENEDNTRIYAHAFASKEAEEEFREAGYTIVEES